MIENSEDLAKLITWENGKPLADAKGEVTYAANFFEWFSEEAPRVYGDTIPASIAGNRVITIKEPIGVCGLITPYVSSVLQRARTDIEQMEFPSCHDNSKNWPSSCSRLHSSS